MKKLNLFYFRMNYRQYKDLYKQRLAYPDATNIIPQMDEIAVQLDVANLTMAREQARLEVCFYT